MALSLRPEGVGAGPPGTPSSSALRIARRPERVELFGEYRGAGQEDRRFLARSEASWVQLTPLLYLLLVSINGERSSTELAEILHNEAGVDVDTEDVEFLVNERLAPLGLATFAMVDPSPTPKINLALGLRFRRGLIPSKLVHGVASVLHPLFALPVVIAVLGGFIAADIALLRPTALKAAGETVLKDPLDGLAVLGLVLVCTFFHELGHASACRHGGGRPGEIGIGFYLLWPVMYTNVSDSYRLSRASRVRTDLGGVYFNALAGVVLAISFGLTHDVALGLAAIAMNLLILEQLLPFVRFDGYWVLSDLTGVPDLFAKLGAAVRRLAFWRPCDPALAELRKGPRRAVMAWAYLCAIVLCIEGVVLLLAAPSIAVTSALQVRLEALSIPSDYRHSLDAALALHAVNILLIAVFGVGLCFAVVFLSYRSIRGVMLRPWRTPVRLAACVLLVAAIASTIGFSASRVHLLNPRSVEVSATAK